MYSVELHEEAQTPQIVGLIIIHGTSPHDVILRGVAKGAWSYPPPHALCVHTHLDHFHEWIVTALQYEHTQLLQDKSNAVSGDAVTWGVLSRAPQLVNTTWALLRVKRVVVQSWEVVWVWHGWWHQRGVALTP